MSKRIAYTKEMLEPLVRVSFTVSQVCRLLGKRADGNVSTYMARRIRDFGIDTTHFLGARFNSGSRYKGGSKRRPWQEILIKRDSGSGQKTNVVRRALIESGRAHQCEICGMEPVWNGKPLVLQVDHVNGDGLDDRAENLRFLDPNCHAQTETWGARNIGKVCV